MFEKNTKIKKKVRFNLSFKNLPIEKNKIPYRKTPYIMTGGVSGDKISRKTRKKRR